MGRWHVQEHLVSQRFALIALFSDDISRLGLQATLLAFRICSGCSTCSGLVYPIVNT